MKSRGSPAVATGFGSRQRRVPEENVEPGFGAAHEIQRSVAVEIEETRLEAVGRIADVLSPEPDGLGPGEDRIFFRADIPQEKQAALVRAEEVLRGDDVDEAVAVPIRVPELEVVGLLDRPTEVVDDRLSAAEARILPSSFL